MAIIFKILAIIFKILAKIYFKPNVIRLQCDGLIDDRG